MPHPPRKFGDPPYRFIGRPKLTSAERARRRQAKKEETKEKAKMGRPPLGLWPEVDRKELARQIGLHPVTVRKILLGTHEATPDAIRDIAFILRKEPWRVRRALKEMFERRKSEF